MPILDESCPALLAAQKGPLQERIAFYEGFQAMRCDTGALAENAPGVYTYSGSDCRYYPLPEPDIGVSLMLGVVLLAGLVWIERDARN